MQVLAGDVIDERRVQRPIGRAGAAVFAYQAYRQRGVAPARHLGLPSPYLTLIFTLDEPLQIAQHVDPRRPAGLYDALAGGLHTSPAVVAHSGAQSGIQLLVNPLAARPLFGQPAGELTGYDGDAGELLGGFAAEVHDQLREAPGWAERFGVLDRALDARLRRPTRGAGPVPAVARAWTRLLASRGRLPVQALADSVGYSTRRLGGLFRTEIGLPPKTAARVIRFDRARRAMQRTAGPGRPRLGDIAARYGYCDQSHLVRDFAAFTCRAPGRWLAEEFRNVQANPAAEASEWAT